MRICIVTSELYGPSLSGGIGQTSYNYAKLFVSQGHELTVLLTHSIANKTLKHWKGFYLDLGIDLVGFGELEEVPDYYFPRIDFLSKSTRLYSYLRGKDFALIMFNDYLAEGFISIQAKRTGLAFFDTAIIVLMGGPTEWVLEAASRLDVNNGYTTRMNWCERYCCEHADILLAPSQYIFDWALSHNWVLAKDRRVIPNYIEGSGVLSRVFISSNIDFGHLIFFGASVSTRKGVDIFCLAIEKLLNDKKGVIKKLSFLGRKGEIVDAVVKESSSTYIKRFSKVHTDLEIRVENGLDSFAAMNYIKSSGGVVVMPTPSENFSNAVLECLANNVPFIASSVGGIPEFAPRELLFAFNVNALAEKILSLEALFPGEYEIGYSRESIVGQWEELFGNLPKRKALDLKASPKVTLCMAYYNNGKYLPTTLESLKGLDYDNYELIVVNDASDDEYSNEVFDEMREKYKGWKFFRFEENRGLSVARNFAASKSSGEYIMSVDSDDIYQKDMLKVYVRSMEVSGVDCLTGYYKSFIDVEGKPDDCTISRGMYTPIGPCLELGVLENMFGGSYFFVKRGVFNDLGGFDPSKRIYEDFQFLLRLSLKGYKQDVVPRQILWYRVRKGSLFRISSRYDRYKTIVEEYNAVLPSFARYMNSQLLTSYLSPSFYYTRDRSSSLAGLILYIRDYVAKNLSRFPFLFRLSKFAYLLIFKLNRRVIKLFRS